MRGLQTWMKILTVMSLAAVAAAAAAQEHLPLPYSAEQLRGAWPEGLVVVNRITSPEAVLWSESTVTKADENGMTSRDLMVDEEGVPVGEPTTSTSSWSELRDHALFEAARSERERVSHTTPLGRLEGWLYRVECGEDCVTELFFADRWPGPPVVYRQTRGGVDELVVEMVERRLPEAAAPPAEEAEAVEALRQWPRWRGPLGTGVAPHGDPPTTWSEEENVRFKVAVPGRGLASPVVWGEKIFILTAVAADEAAYAASQVAAAKKLENRDWPPSVDPVEQRFEALAYSRHDGRLLWRRTAAQKVPHESHYIDASWASASPVTDGERLFAHFGSNGLFAYDLEGNLLWQVDLGDMSTRNGFGEGSSPALFGDSLVVNWDHEGDSFLVVLDAATGEERWRVERPGEVTSWATPLVVDLPGADSAPQIVIPATGKSRGYDLRTGKEIWRLSGMTVNTIPTPVHRDGVVYLTSGYRGNMLQAVDLARARGELEGSDAVVWTHERHTPYVPSTLLYDDKIYFLKHFKNIITCLDAATGEVHFTETRLDGITNVYASPVGASGRVYIVGRDGAAIVLEHGPEYKVLAQNQLDDGFDASPAIVGDTMYLRGRKYLYAIGK